MEINLINTEDKPITGIRKRLISNDIQKVNPDFKTLVNFFMKADREGFYDNKQLLINLMESTVETALIEGQRTGTKHIEYIKGDKDEYRPKPSEVYKERSDHFVND